MQESPAPQQRQRVQTAAAATGHRKSSLVPVWQRDPHEHWKPPSHYLKKIEQSAKAKSMPRQRGGFPNKYLYPIEVMGLDTLFPD